MSLSIRKDNLQFFREKKQTIKAKMTKCNKEAIA